MYFANFQFNEEWQGDQILKKLENLIVACNYTNCAMPSQGWEISIPQPNQSLFCQNIQLEVTYNMI